MEEAIAELQQAQKDEKLKWKAAMFLGVCFKQRNNWRLAQRNFEEALRGRAPATEEPARRSCSTSSPAAAPRTATCRARVDLGHELANLDFAFKNIGKLLDEWNDRMQSA